MIPVLDPEEGKYTLAESFHNAGYACIYDSDQKSYEWLETSSLSDKEGNLSIELKQKGILGVLINKMSAMSLGLFIDSGFRVFQAENINLRDNIEIFHMQQLKYYQYTPDYAPDACSGSCSSCGTTSSGCNI